MGDGFGRHALIFREALVAASWKTTATACQTAENHASRRHPPVLPRPTENTRHCLAATPPLVALLMAFSRVLRYTSYPLPPPPKTPVPSVTIQPAIAVASLRGCGVLVADLPRPRPSAICSLRLVARQQQPFPTAIRVLRGYAAGHWST